MTEPSHTITVFINARYPHGERAQASVTMAGDGDIAHAMDTFTAALVAMGFSAELAGRLMLRDE